MADEAPLPDENNVLPNNPDDYDASGFQSGLEYPLVPQTQADFRNHVENSGKPPENQSAPPLELLNPHLFPQRLP